MAYKAFLLHDKPITIYKRRGARSLKLSVAANGQVKVTIPSWTSYKVGLEFAKSKADWIKDQTARPIVLTPNQAVGKAHHLEFIESDIKDKPTSRITNNSITISYPSWLTYTSPEVQLIAQKACSRALRSQAEALLPQRLKTLAEKYGFDYGSISIKQLKGRWGSCDQNKDIVLNLYLMQMPWQLIDYVIVHELTHTKVLRHGPDFWRVMESVMPEAKTLKKQLRAYQPIVNGSLDGPVA
jgi:predicted metal-dependent hydrolase